MTYKDYFGEGSILITCAEAVQLFKPWLMLLIVVPLVINLTLIFLLGVTINQIRKLCNISDTMTENTHWLMRISVQIGLGPKAKAALMDYARTRPHLAHLTKSAEKKN